LGELSRYGHRGKGRGSGWQIKENESGCVSTDYTFVKKKEGWPVIGVKRPKFRDDREIGLELIPTKQLPGNCFVECKHSLEQ